MSVLSDAFHRARSLIRPRIVCIRQFSEEDCGAACLATISAHYGSPTALGRLRELVGTTANGTSLLGLKRGAEQLGFIANAAKADPTILSRLEDLPKPIICHWNGNHWVVLHGRNRQGRLLIADPAVGIRELTDQEFIAHWQNGILLLLEPDPARFQHADQEETASRGLWIFFDFLLPFRSLLTQALLLNILIGVLALAMPMLMQILTDDVLVRGDRYMLTSLGVGIILLTTLRHGLGWLQGRMVGHFGQKLQLQMILHYGQRLFSLPLSYFESHRSGEVVSRVSDIQRINELLTSLVTGLPSQLCIAVISFALMLSYSSSLAVAALLCYVAVVSCNLCFLPLIQAKMRQIVVHSSENQGYLVEVFRAASVLKATQATPQAWQEYQRNFGRLARLNWAGTQLRLNESTTTGLLGALSSIVLLWYGSGFVMNDDLSIGQLLAFNGMGANVLAFLAGLSAVSQEAITAGVVLRRLSEVMERDPEDVREHVSHRVVISPQSSIRFENISWHYPGCRSLLHRFNLEIPGGLTTAIIGQSGCGKSSLSKLMAAIYSPDEGAIYYGDFCSRDLNLACLREQVSLVPQESQFFNRSIFDNFSFSHPGIAFADVVRACQLVLADEFINQLPDGYGTVLGEYGANLSGGQRQRLALARALVTDPPILILDESTSALDPVLEQRLMERLLASRKGKTTILISHRPSVILRSDWIVYLDSGSVKYQNRPAALKHTAQVAPFLSPV